jgi:hypothetical protein
MQYRNVATSIAADRQASEWNWLAAATTTSQIAAGRVGVNHDQPSQATQLRLHRLDYRNIDYGRVLGLMTTGDLIYLQVGNQATSWHRYRLTGPPTIDADNWLVPVQTNGGSPANTEPANGTSLLVTFQYKFVVTSIEP